MMILASMALAQILVLLKIPISARVIFTMDMLRAEGG
jgi:hypothetical protein